jgi:hypothetical protein
MARIVSFLTGTIVHELGSYSNFRALYWCNSLTTHRTPAEESLDRIIANLAGSAVDDEIVLRPPVCGRTEDLVKNRVMLAQKEHCDQSWGGSTISSRVTNYIGQFDKTQ